MEHNNHATINNDMKELLWEAFTCNQVNLRLPAHPVSLREQLRAICNATPSFEQFSTTLHAKSNDSSPGITGLSYRLLKLLEPQYLQVIYEQLAVCWSVKHIPDWWLDKLLVPLPKSSDPSDVIPLTKL
jgi:hypothetical protein